MHTRRQAPTQPSRGHHRRPLGVLDAKGPVEVTSENALTLADGSVREGTPQDFLGGLPTSWPQFANCWRRGQWTDNGSIPGSSRWTVLERRAGFEPAALRLCRPFPWSARAPARDQQAYRWLPHGRCPTEAADQRSRVRAATAATIDAAPASLRRPATSARVAPVSTTSSTNSTWRPATGSRAS